MDHTTNLSRPSDRDFCNLLYGLNRVNAEMTIVDSEWLPEPVDW